MENVGRRRYGLTAWAEGPDAMAQLSPAERERLDALGFELPASARRLGARSSARVGVSENRRGSRCSWRCLFVRGEGFVLRV